MLNLNTSTHYTYLANREAVRVYTRAGAMLGSVPDAKRTKTPTEERARAGGVYIGTGCDWRLPRIQITASLVPGCFVVDSEGVAYVIQGLDPPGSWGGQWNCRCLALMVLGNTIVWHLPTRQVDSFGSPDLDQSSTLGPMPAGITEQMQEEVIFQGIVSGFRRHFNIWVMGQMALPLGTIGVDQSGLTYTVKGVTQIRVLDQLLTIEAVIEP